MPSQIEKLHAHASHLLDAFIRLRERYSLLDPMLFNELVPKQRGSGKQARGFLTLRHSLFLSCAQDIAKLSLDDDKRTRSIKNLIGALENSAICNELREQFSCWQEPTVDEETDPEIVEILKKMAIRAQEDRRVQFDNILSDARTAWIELSGSQFMDGFLTIRDKVAAHTEVQFVADKYQFVDIGELGVKWSDLRRAIDMMQKLVESLGLLIRNAGFAWESLDAQLSKASNSFWLPTST